MTSAADWIDTLLQRGALRARLRGGARAEGEFPPGWMQWFAAMRPRRDAVTGDTAQHWVDLLAAREPALPPRASRMLNRWQAFATLWRQDWHPPAREDRRVRMFAASVSVLVHVLFAVGLLYLALLQWVPLERAAPAPPGEDVIQVEYVGVAAREDVGGGEPQPTPAERTPDAASEASSSSAASTPPTPTVAIETPVLDAAIPDVPQRDVPEPVQPPPVATQPLVVSAPAPDPEQVFVLPPTSPRIETAPVTPRFETRVPEVRIAEVPAPVQPPRVRIAPTVTPAPRVAVREVEIATREIPTPVVAPTARVQPTVTVAPRALPSTAPRVATRTVPMPASATASASTATPASAAASSSTATSRPSTAAAPGTTASTPAARPGATPSPGAGPKPSPAPGAWPSANRGDDFDTASRDRAGGTRGVPGGLYNPDGSVRLGDRPGSASSGLPPGSLVQEIPDIDRAGTWLRRRPPDYQGTRFDEAWRPNETLLAEWVRKSVTTVSIPIPGTKKRIVCKTVLLAVGGSCTVIDPDLNDQPARARPPPDIPFKPHLQEDNGAVKPAG